MEITARLGLKDAVQTCGYLLYLGRNGDYSPIGIESDLPRASSGTSRSRNGDYSPIGIESGTTCFQRKSECTVEMEITARLGLKGSFYAPIPDDFGGRNGDYSPIGIESMFYGSLTE